ncbi:Exonuclease mut-7 [Phytophthora citrophthora]|uniref:Exonuclease mut-7 n=1 Tax=Phytophthora citrophthora TaxID=4793 RepID=A0AAD9FYL0_9STRA|nr:Exonuclease mut-7 [Phytophthora citrophthora]
MELLELLEQGKDGDVSEWVCCIHRAFYQSSTTSRGVNKFLELETILTQTFTALSADAVDDFWAFAVLIVLHLAHETPRTGEENDTDSRRPIDKKTKKKRSQPNAPLAFLVINALRKVAGVKDNALQLHNCHLQGQRNEMLRDFCLRGLGDENFVDQKLVVEIVDLFAITDIDHDVVRCAAQSLLTSKKYTALMKLLAIFNSVEWSFVSMIKTMAQWKDWSAAELFARTFGFSDDKGLARVLVDEAIAIQDVKRAHRIVHNFNLQEDYPDIGELQISQYHLLYCHDGLMKLMERQRWQMALSFAGNDVTLQKLLFDHLMAAGEIQWASHLAQILEIPDFETRVGELVAQHGSLRMNGLSYSAKAAALNGCLSLEFGSESVVFCDTEESLRSAMKHFFGEDSREDDSISSGFHATQIVGLDVEWKPTSTKIAAATGSSTTTAVASILQISSSSRAFIIDLLSLRVGGIVEIAWRWWLTVSCSSMHQDNDFLFENFLGRLLTCPSLLKVGFGFDTDLKVLHQTFPERSALTSISPFLELNCVVSKLLGVTVGNSLSNATRTVLGSPLDKRMQMSNWDVRPLTAAQLTYAALDAYCLVQITQKLNEEERLPSWQSTAAEIHTLAYSSPLTDAEASEVIALREKYCQDWMENKAQTNSGDVVASLLTPQDVEEFWEERRQKHQEEAFELLQTGGGAVAEVLDTALTFLDPLTVKGLLGQAKDSEKPVVFVAVNSICFFADEEPCVACIEANCKLDTAQLAALCGVSRRRIKLATPAECCESFGFEPGTIPPFGHRSARADPEQPQHPIRVYASNTLQHVEFLVCGGGSHDALLWLNSKAYFALIEVEATGDIQRGLSAVEPPTPSKEAVAPNAEQKRQESIREYKFLADSMVARVGKWLRTIGMDVIIWDPYSVPKKTASQDHKAALLALSVCEQRILLTRDKKLAGRRDAGACFVVSSDDPFKQFQEIKTHFALKLVKEEMMSRCSRCNAKGFDVVDLDYVRNQTEDEVHPNVLEVVTEFWVCRVCHKIYWEGPKYDSNYANLLRMFDEDSIVEK